MTIQQAQVHEEADRAARRPSRDSHGTMLRLLAGVYFALCGFYYRLRYAKRLRLGSQVRILGRLRIGRGTQVRIGDHTRLRGRVIIDSGGVVDVGANCLLNGCWIGAADRVTVEDWCLLSDCYICDTDYHNVPPHIRHSPVTPLATSPIRIRRNAWVGARASVFKGVTIGIDSVVGGCATVRQDVPAGVVVVGDPQRIVKTFDYSTDPAPKDLADSTEQDDRSAGQPRRY